MKTAFTDAPVLTALLEGADLKLVDVGGRGEAFGPLAPLAPFARYFCCEPDGVEAARLAETLPIETPWRGVTVMTEAMATRRGHAELRLTQQPGMSSLLEPDERVAARFYLAPKFRVVSTATVPTMPLDDAAAGYGFTDACFLKVDTQGTELDILQSGANLVRGPLLGVHVESLFQPIYKGQSLFADVDDYLRGHGFSLFSLSRTSLRRAGYRPELHSKRMIAWAHCLYLREPASVAERGATAAADLPRLLGLALAFQQFDLAFEVISLCAERRLLPEPDIARLTGEVETYATRTMHQILRKAAKQEPPNLADALVSPSLRDKKRIE
jgi:FkbM family methyltransferase